MALSLLTKKNVLLSMFASVLAMASVACGSADGSEHPTMSESSVSAQSTPAEEVCTPGAVEMCKQYFTAYGTTNCIPGFRECGDDARWSECGQGVPDSGTPATH